MYCISASIGKKVCARIVMFDRHFVEKCGFGGLPLKIFFEAMPSRTLENTLFAK